MTAKIRYERKSFAKLVRDFHGVHAKDALEKYRNALRYLYIMIHGAYSVTVVLPHPTQTMTWPDESAAERFTFNAAFVPFEL